MIKLGRLITNTPIPVVNNVYFYQTTVREVLDMGENMYWSLLKLWYLNRDDLISEETTETSAINDFELWKGVMMSTPEMKSRLATSVQVFLHTKIEFLPISNTIMIGEDDCPILLDEHFYFSMRNICSSLYELDSEKEDTQYKETKNMSARERQMIEKMRKREEQLNKIKNGEQDMDNRLVKQIISLVAIGHYTFEEVCDMTMVQIINLLKKYIDIQQYELYTILSPYMDSKKNQAPKHWLDT